MFIRCLKHLSLYLGLAAVLCSCAVAPQGVTRTPLLAPLADTTSVRKTEYAISVGDEIEIRFADRADMIQTFRVQPDGRITPPYLPPMTAAGRSLSDLTTELKKTLAGLGGKDAVPHYILTVGDELDIRFVNHPTLNQLVRIRPDGRVTLPYIKSIAAEGKTPEDFERELIEQYGEYLKRPDLTVGVRGFSSNRVRVGERVLPGGLINSEPIVSLKSFAVPQIFIGGEVLRPGVLNYRNNMTLLQAIFEAGGHKPSGEMRSVIVLRKSADSGLMIRRDLLSDLAEGTTNDIPLEPSDVVVVPKTNIASVAEVIDQYLYQPFSFMRNSSFGFVYNLTPTSTVNVK